MQRTTLIFAMAAGILVFFNLPETEARMTLTQIKNAMKGMAKTCVSKTGVNQDLIVRARSGDFADDKALQCYYLCLFTQMKAAKDGKLVLDSMLKQMDMMFPLDIMEPAKAGVMKCFAEATSEDNCERSWQFNNCYYNNDPTLYFFP